VDVHVARLRQKLVDPQSPRRIQTVRGKGYKFTW
jgi:DNA-binding response OmpR family regulator